MFESWNAPRAHVYRRTYDIPDDLGTAVNVVQMVFGNKGDQSGTGVAFTRDPNTGENLFYGDYLVNAQGEDVVAGIRTPEHIAHLGKHPTLVRDVDRAVVVVDKSTDADACWAHQVDIARLTRGKHLLEHHRGVVLDKIEPTAIQIDDVV